jgi:hypothetical protein
VAVAVTAMSRLDPPADTAEAQHFQAAKLEPVPGTKLSRVTLTADAMRHLGIQTGTVRDGQIGGKPKLVVPYTAVLYDPAGVAWVYTNPAPLTYQRQRITVEAVQGDSAALSEGPAPGTTIVVVGSAELYGTELRVGSDG